VRNYVVIAFKGKIDMTNNLVAQLWYQGDTDRIVLFNNGEPEAALPWDCYTEVITFDAQDLNLHEMWNAGRRYFDTYHRVTRNRHDGYNVAILNNDIVLDHPHFVQELANGLQTAEYCWLVSGNEGFDYPDDGHDVAWGEDSTGLRGATMMFRGDLPFWFDERFWLIHGDRDLHWKIQNEGFWLGIVKNARYTHLGGGSVTRKSEDQARLEEIYAHDHALLKLKWPHVPLDTYCFPHRSMAIWGRHPLAPVCPI
jgi:hypothetical protein